MGASKQQPPVERAKASGHSLERMVSLHARWLVDAAEYREIAKTSMAANRMLSHQLHTGRAEMLEQCAAELRAGMEANDEALRLRGGKGGA